MKWDVDTMCFLEIVERISGDDAKITLGDEAENTVMVFWQSKPPTWLILLLKHECCEVGNEWNEI